uniref:Uncharacterized protein n=1 Tax=Physcomitrium patens TaxID=3218 RepID=A0A7I4C9L4_PHYPA
MSEHNGDLVVEPYIGKCDDCMLVLDSEWQLGCYKLETRILNPIEVLKTGGYF